VDNRGPPTSTISCIWCYNLNPHFLEAKREGPRKEVARTLRPRSLTRSTFFRHKSLEITCQLATPCFIFLLLSGIGRFAGSVGRLVTTWQPFPEFYVGGAFPFCEKMPISCQTIASRICTQRRFPLLMPAGGYACKRSFLVLKGHIVLF
jgi:hypothetical protein